MQDRTRVSLVLFSLVIGWASVPSAQTSSAQTPAPNPALNGTWRLAGTLEQAQATVAAAVEPAVATLTPDIQRLARVRIAESTAVPNAIEIQAAAAQIHVAIVGGENRAFDSAPGAPQNVYSRSGVRAELTQTYRPDGAIEQRFRAIDGTQWNFYTPQPDGQTLHLDVLMRSRRLTQDVRFQLTFVR